MRIMNRKLKIMLIGLVVIFVISLTTHANAYLIAGQDIIDAPSSVQDDFPGAENDHQQAFNEKQLVLLNYDLAVDGGFISAGTIVNSHMIFLNSPGSNVVNDVSVEWQFDGTILGVMSDTNGSLEDSSNQLLAATGTYYPGSFNFRGLEVSDSNDSYSIFDDTIIVTMGVGEPGDWIRVVTSPVPIPGAIWLFGPAIIAFTGIRMRMKK